MSAVRMNIVLDPGPLRRKRVVGQAAVDWKPEQGAILNDIRLESGRGDLYDLIGEDTAFLRSGEIVLRPPGSRWVNSRTIPPGREFYGRNECWSLYLYRKPYVGHNGRRRVFCWRRLRGAL